MMATQEKAAPLRAERPNQHHHAESNTTCAYCSEGVNVYRMGDKWICTDHLAASVSVACDIWPDAVSYTREFEDVLIYG